MKENFDVIVAGGGPAGFAASLAAARQGAKTLLVEATGCIGGQATSGLVGPFMTTYGSEGVYQELLKRMAAFGGWKQNYHVCFDAEILKYCMQIMLEEAGVQQLLFTMTADALVQDNRVQGIQIVNKGGLQKIHALQVIDCTGDGDVAASAGAEYEKGDEDNKMQAVSLFFTIGGVDDKVYTQEAYMKYRDICREVCPVEQKFGNFNLPAYAMPMMVYKGSTLNPGEYSVNVDMVTGIDGTDPWQLTKAMNESRKRVFETVSFLQKYLPGGRNCFLTKTASILGVRETRRFKGLESVCGQDVVDGHKRTDAIARASFFLDLHDKGWSDDENSIGGPNVVRKFGGKNAPPENDWYDIPYGALIPKEHNGLLLAGRCVSSDRYANGSLRVMPTCMALGQAAGIAASLCVQNGIEARALAVEKVQKLLRENYNY